MAIYIRECLTGGEPFYVDWNCTPNSVKESSEQPYNVFAPGSIMADHEALHVGPTRNNTWYTDECLEDCIPSWTYPYARPLIMHHNEKDGRTIGRVVRAHYIKKSSLSNTGALCLRANVPDDEGKKGIKDNTLLTVSIGAIVHEAECSICGHDIANEGQCEHERGAVYDGKTCYWMIKKMEAKELSYVIVPSDPYAQRTSWKEVGQKEIAESMNLTKKGALNIMENMDNKDVTTQESTQVDEEVKNEIETQPEAKPEEVKTEEPKAEKGLDELVKELQKELAEVKKANAILVASLDAEKDKVADYKKQLDAIRDSLTVKEGALQKEIELREGLEQELARFKVSEKVALAESVYELRAKLNKREIAKESLQEKSLEFLTESLEDLKAELEVTESATDETEATDTVKAIQEGAAEVTNPAVVEESTKKPLADVKENASNSNMNVEESLINIFTSLM